MVTHRTSFGQRLRYLVFAIAFIGSLVFGLSVMLFSEPEGAQAQKAFFYPETCLGGWKGASNASGVPDALEEQKYTDKNSATFTDGDSAIFCGQFAGELPVQTYHTRVSLRFSWYQDTLEPLIIEDEDTLRDVLVDIINGSEAQNETSGEEGGASSNEEEVGDLIDAPEIPSNDVIATTSEVFVDVATSTSAEAEADELGSDSAEADSDPVSEESQEGSVQTQDPDTEVEGSVLPEEEAEVIQEEPQSEVSPEPVDESVAEETAWWKSLISTVYAEELGASTVEEVSSSTVPVEVVAIADTKAVAIDENTDALFSIEYTLDGVTWHNVGYVTNISNDIRFELPKEALVTIEDIAKVQIALRPLLRYDYLPAVFLDSMWFEVSYAPTRELGVHALSSLVPEMVDFEEFFHTAGVLNASTSLEGMSVAEFASSTTFIHGIDGRYALVGIHYKEAQELWLMDSDLQTITRIGFNGAAIGAYPVGAKERMIFWLNHDASILFTYDLRTGGSLHEMALVGNLPEDGDKRFTFPFTQWQVIWRSDEFYFFKDTPGEVFKDEDAKAAERLSEYLSQVKGEEVVDVEQVDSATSTDTISPLSATTTIDSEIQNENI